MRPLPVTQSREVPHALFPPFFPRAFFFLLLLFCASRMALPAMSIPNRPPPNPPICFCFSRSCLRFAASRFLDAISAGSSDLFTYNIPAASVLPSLPPHRRQNRASCSWICSPHVSHSRPSHIFCRIATPLWGTNPPGAVTNPVPGDSPLAATLPTTEESSLAPSI